MCDYEFVTSLQHLINAITLFTSTEHRSDYQKSSYMRQSTDWGTEKQQGSMTVSHNCWSTHSNTTVQCNMGSRLCQQSGRQALLNFVIPVPETGDLLDCNNWHCITLSVRDKVTSSILLERLQKALNS